MQEAFHIKLLLVLPKIRLSQVSEVVKAGQRGRFLEPRLTAGVQDGLNTLKTCLLVLPVSPGWKRIKLCDWFSINCLLCGIYDGKLKCLQIT